MVKNWRTWFGVGLVALVVAGQAVAQTEAKDAGEEYPPDAKPGECWAKCIIKAKYETYTEKVLVREASNRVEVLPAVYGTETEQIMIRPESKRLEVVPATYETVTERVMVKDASKRLVKVPVVYENVEEKIEVSPATTRWVKGKASKACLSANPEDCRVWCLVQVPAKYSTVTKRVLKTPETTREVEVPAEYATVTKRVLKTPASTREIVVPAQYQTVAKTVVKSEPSTRQVEVPEEYRIVTRERLASPAGVGEWRRVICEDALTSGKIREIQLALKAKGLDPGPIDNLFGAQTREALVRYQRAKKLPEGNLDFETLKSLGIEN